MPRIFNIGAPNLVQHPGESHETEGRTHENLHGQINLYSNHPYNKYILQFAVMGVLVGVSRQSCFTSQHLKTPSKCSLTRFIFYIRLSMQNHMFLLSTMGRALQRHSEFPSPQDHCCPKNHPSC